MLNNNEIFTMNRLNLSIYSVIQIFVLCVVVSNSQAALYKWVDADGNTHYTQSPPTGGIEADVIKPPPKIDTNKALDKLEEQQKYLDGLQEERGKQAKKQQNEEANEAVRKSNCELGKDKLTHLTDIPRIQKVDKDGNVSRLTEEERQAKIKKAQELIDKECKK